VRYYDLIDFLIAGGKIKYADPDIVFDILQLQILADQIADRVVFVKRCNLFLTNIEMSDLPHVNDLHRSFDFNAPSGRVPQAMIYYEVGGKNDSLILSTPEIHFFHERFLTVGVLLHELAHLYQPLGNHNSKFYLAEKRLKTLYGRWFPTPPHPFQSDPS